MDKNAVIDIVRRYRKAIETRNIRVNKIVLFGSYTSGNQFVEARHCRAFTIFGVVE